MPPVITKSITDDRDLETLINSLYNYPIGTREYDQIRYNITSKLTEPKYKEMLIAFKSRMHRNYYNDPSREHLEKLNEPGVTPSIKWNPFGTTNVPIDPFFSSGSTFLEGQRFEFIERKELEYNPEYRQLVVATYITDGNHIILLRTGTNGETRIHGKLTFIQGHVVFDEKAYVLSQKEFLVHNILKEIHEEIELPIEIKTLEPAFYMNDTRNYIGLEHFGIVYEITVDNLLDIEHKIRSKEESKHEVVMLNLANYQDFKDDLDTWARIVLEARMKR